MKIHRFIGGFDLRRKGLELDDRDLLNQLHRVLKLKPGELVELCDGAGYEARYRIEEVGAKRAVLVRETARAKNMGEPARHIVLYAALLKRENFAWAVQKATECGVAEIVPVLTDRTIKKGMRHERLVHIAKEAAEQSGRGRVPMIESLMHLKEALAHAELNNQNVFFHASEAGSRVRHPRQDRGSSNSLEVWIPSESIPTNVGAGVTRSSARSTDDNHRIGLFVGPEGGWTEDEVKLAKMSGCKITSLGPRILRGETAAIVSVFLATSDGIDWC